MGSVSRSTSRALEQPSVRPATRTVLGSGEGIRLVATCLWRSPGSQMSVCEVYEWLAEEYPQYEYTKIKIRKVLLHDSEREQPRFMIANRRRLPGVPCKWAIRPEMEPEVGRLCEPLLRRETQVPQSLGDTLQPNRYGKSNLTFDRPGSMPQSESLSTASRSSSTDKSSRTCWCLSHREPSGNPPFGTWDDFQEREFEEAEEARDLERMEASKRINTKEGTAKMATSVISTRHDRTGNRQPSRGGFVGDFDNSKNSIFYTKAAIAFRKGVAELGRVKIDGNCMRNLLPRPIADELGLPLHFGSTIGIRVEDRRISTSHYCRFSIQVAGVETAINACVVSELSSLLLGREWIQEANLLRDFENHIYIPGPLGRLNEVPSPVPAIEAESDFVAEGHVPTVVEAPVAEELDSAAESMESATGSETLCEDEVWEDTVSRQSSDDNIYSVNRILAEKQEHGRTYYLVLWDGYTEDQCTWEPLQNIRDKTLLDIWRERKVKEQRGIVPAFDHVNFEEQRQKRLDLGNRRSKIQMKHSRDPCNTNHTSPIAKKRWTTFPGDHLQVFPGPI